VVELAPGVERIQTGYQNFTSVGAYAYAGYQYPVIFGSSYVRDEQGRIVVDSRETVAGAPNPFHGMPLAGPEKILGKCKPGLGCQSDQYLEF
jgi:hypothetical protein